MLYFVVIVVTAALLFALTKQKLKLNKDAIYIDQLRLAQTADLIGFGFFVLFVCLFVCFALLLFCFLEIKIMMRIGLRRWKEVL